MLKLLVNAIYLIAIIQAAVDTKEEFKTTSTTCINKCYKVGHTHCINSMFNKGVCCAYSDKKKQKECTDKHDICTTGLKSKTYKVLTCPMKNCPDKTGYFFENT